jgi:hypothetical protein
MTVYGISKPAFEAQGIMCEHDLRTCSLERSAGRVEKSNVDVHVITVPKSTASKADCIFHMLKHSIAQVIAQHAPVALVRFAFLGKALNV